MSQRILCLFCTTLHVVLYVIDLNASCNSFLATS